ncbi:alpha/beta fold hydrolase [Streptomyces sp. A3M-1-3]|uniref:alpha/beta fold hydrolase n=1 Tax=Streptomyces sp. A3M-1-3 TaxID=2962044 RepID=UPI0020B6E757|nr:alpha/beta fold hydrolase [Streptomyces sp. A3M-1-3]MCP3818466.1 alpha/beta fold hydrolase [Streptomyces sp. A3M-1-3]
MARLRMAWTLPTTLFVLLTALLAALLAGASAAPAAAATYPVPYNPSIEALISATSQWDSAPAGANISTCQPSAAHPSPVILVHGTYANQNTNWVTASPLLANSGYCVYTFNYGSGPTPGPVHATQHIANSIPTIKAKIDEVLASTGAAKVDLVAHSQGGLLARAYLKQHGGARVGNLVAISTPHHGTDLSLGEDLVSAVGELLDLSPAPTPFDALSDQAPGSAFLTDLNAGGETVPGVTYTNIASGNDWFMAPSGSTTWGGTDPNTAFMTGASVTNIRIQDSCKLDFSDHASIHTSQNVLNHVLNALDPAHPVPVGCVFAPPLVTLGWPDLTEFDFPHPYLGRESNGTDVYRTWKIRSSGSLNYALTDSVGLAGPAIVQSYQSLDMDDDWAIATAPNGYSMFFNRVTGDCMGVSGDSKADLAGIVAQGCAGTPGQMWKIETANSSNKVLRNLNSNKCVRVHWNNLYLNGAALEQLSCDLSTHNFWYE